MIQTDPADSIDLKGTSNLGRKLEIWQGISVVASLATVYSLSSIGVELCKPCLEQLMKKY